MRTIPVQFTAFVFLVSSILVPLTGCVSRLIYQGDGRLQDRSILAVLTPENRYTLHLQTLSFTESGTYEFRMANLPNSIFVVGLQINEHVDIVSKARTVIRMRLVNDRNDKVIDVQSELKDWTLSYIAGGYAMRDGVLVFAYIGGWARSARETTAGSKRADCGHGTYFAPRKWSDYTLVVTIQAAAESPVTKAKLVLEDTVPIKCE